MTIQKLKHFKILEKKCTKDLLDFVFSKEENILKWITKNRSFSSITSGSYSFSFARFPFQKKIVEAMWERDGKPVFVMAGSQVGKSEMYLNLILYHAENREGNILLLFSNEKTARDFITSRFIPMLENSERFKNIFPTDVYKSKKVNRIDSRTFVGKFKGSLFIKSGSVPSSYRSLTASLVILDEIDVYKKSDGLDPIAQIETRMSSFEKTERKLIVVSTPISLSKSIIKKHFDKSSQNEYLLYCSGCQGHFEFSEDLVTKEDDNFYLICSVCQFKNIDKIKSIENGKWIQTSDGRGYGFHFSRFLNPTMDFEEFFDLKNYRLRKDFESDIMGRPYDDSYNTPFFADMLNRRIDFYGSEQNRKKAIDTIDIITAASDLQEDRIETEIVGWGKNEEDMVVSYSLEYIVFKGSIGSPLFWKDFSDKIYSFDFFGKKIDSYAIDCGYRPDLVRGFINSLKKRNIDENRKMRVAAIRGMGRSNHPDEIFYKNIYMNGRRSSNLDFNSIVVISGFIKDILFSDFNGSPHTFFFPINRELYYFKSLFSEEKNAFKGWVKIHIRNEALDCRVYNMALRNLYFKYPIKKPMYS